ncbi:hypothetical protein GGP41_005478 [Bipolaris sorokiniana]|uniref:Uncharacterized protein n=1 Tax=Cochliobolus sativus TaxID=45130 RepID=A0A8H5ZGI8_COCSA|nr:hypothetical protein GGP41_005478 [Bipolaris sorokiniana]
MLTPPMICLAVITQLNEHSVELNRKSRRSLNPLKNLHTSHSRRSSMTAPVKLLAILIVLPTQVVGNLNDKQQHTINHLGTRDCSKSTNVRKKSSRYFFTHPIILTSLARSLGLNFCTRWLLSTFRPEKAHGLAWNFFPKTIEHSVGRSIQFHETQPNNKISFHWARRYGRRLARAYGWTGDIFTLA